MIGGTVVYTASRFRRTFFVTILQAEQIVHRFLSSLLMLFLLLSQQVTLSHAVSHWAPTAIAAAAGEQKLVGEPREAASHLCDLCVAAAQYAAILPPSSLHFQAVAALPVHATTSLAQTFEATTLLAFRSRAPPRA
jgi:hypothetical protein